MEAAFDPYYRWLGIPPSAQPPNHYRLLGLVDYERDAEVIASAADRQANHLRSFLTDKYASHAQQLLNEVAVAKACLLNLDKRAAYDSLLLIQDVPTAKKPVPYRPVIASPPLLPETADDPQPLPEPLPEPLPQALPQPLPQAIPTLPDLEDTLDVAFSIPIAAPGPLPQPWKIRSDWVIFGLASVVVLGGVLWLIGGRGARRDRYARPEPVAASAAGASLTRVVAPPTVPPPPAPDKRRTAGEGGKTPSAAIPGAATKTPTGAGKLPVPNKEILGPIDEKIHEEYGLVLTESPKENRQLAERLLADAQLPDVPVMLQYGLLREVIELATSGNDLRTALRAVDLMAQQFQIDPWAKREDVLGAFAANSGDPADAQAYCEVAHLLIERAILENQLDVALRLAGLAIQIGDKLGDGQAQTDVQRRARRLSDEIEHQLERSQALERLMIAPDDPRANLLLGRWYCFTSNDWATGLPYLAKAEDPELQSIVHVELAKPTDPNVQVVLAERWINAAERQSGFLAAEYQARAVHWYLTAWKNLTGPAQRKVEKTINDLASTLTPSSKAARLVAEGFGSRVSLDGGKP